MPQSSTIIDDPAIWIEAIRAEQARPPKAVSGLVYLSTWEGTSTRPVALTCDDGRDYVVKGINAGRKTVNDQIVGRLARSMGVPVPRVVLVNVPHDLVRAEPMMAHITPGLAHGSELLRNVSESYLIDHVSEPENRLRYARIAVLLGWVTASDRQYLFGEDPPYLVQSFDHTHCFPSPPDWTRVLLNRAPPPSLDHELEEVCRFTASERAHARAALDGMDNAKIARAVAAPPAGWGLDMSERVALASFLARRRLELLRSLAV